MICLAAFICLDSSSVPATTGSPDVPLFRLLNTYLKCTYICISVNMYLLLFNNLCCGLSLPPYGSKLLPLFCPDISSVELLVHPKQTYFAI